MIIATIEGVKYIVTKDILKGFVALSILLAVVGLFFLFNSVNFGTSLAENWLSAKGGSDTTWFQIRVKGNINNFLAAGSIFLGIGLTATIFVSYKLLTFKE